MKTLIVCLFLTILMPYILKLVMGYFMTRVGKGHYDNHLPRVQEAQMTGMGARALAAHKNGFEALAVFATSVLAAMVTGHTEPRVQALAVFYVVSRVFYNLFYLMDKATLRSCVWMLGFLTSLAILLLSL